ncbi:hypothetical protein B488_00280 [Liberibacter crescens BT-1]|uniref:Ribosome maturation factor RimP n=1 Tax=Liberibacter crescens (strain BT-1) TaxID=1215343 RepID=L0EUH9_LIBCB|nr:ribosome maturation factor RimP [Liberibacter crescens]AGA64021.1 hypothetical protein B488_00280 [Liberibacter crescens BT-1]AMC12329.1 hypothetical protein RL73_00325 [Liberibacter crescens]
MTSKAVAVENDIRLIVEVGIERSIADVIEPLIVSMDFRLVQIMLFGKNRLTLQVLVERNDGTMTLKDCEELSRAISPVLDVEDLIDKPYTLEVSSPGINRPMVRKSDFVRWKDFVIKCKTNVMIGNSKKFCGKIFEVGNDSFILEIDLASRVEIPFSSLSMAKLVVTDEMIRNSLAIASK